MTITNQELIHEYFYSGFTSSNYPNYKNCGYHGDTFKSYATAIARVLPDKNGERVCLLSSNTYSTTTAKQLSYVRRACPFTILDVPTRYAHDTITLTGVITDLFKDLAIYHERSTNRKENRVGFMTAYDQLQAVLSHFAVYLTADQLEKLDTYRHFYNSVSDYEKELEERRNARRQERLEKQVAKAQEIMNSDNLLDIVKGIYAKNSPLSYTQKNDLRQALNPDHTLSFVWVDGDTYRTSQGVTVSKREGDLLLKLFAAGKLHHGHKIDRYTVLTVDTNFVKIGCHKIPARNLQELAKAL